MLVGVDHDRVALRCGMVTARFPRRAAVGLRGGPSLALGGEPVLVLAADVELLGDILGGSGIESIPNSA